ncbi:MAG: hypothetical protein FJW30_15900 [Acidobacteria bacterium]|nr:hypothetical protein [Acidobacteriota bacterium]
MRIPGANLFTGNPRARVEEPPLVILPKSKIYWLPLNRPIPKTSPAEAPAEAIPAGRIQRSAESVVVKQPDPVSSKQAIWRPDAPKPLPVETPLPDMVAVRDKPAPKPFVPPAPAKSPPPRPAELAQPDELSPKAQPLPQTTATAIAPLPKFRPKAFVAPKARPKLPIPAGSITDAPPEIEQAAAASAAAASAAGQNLVTLPGGKKPPKAFVPPPAQSAGSGSSNGKSANLETAPDLPAAGTGAVVTAAVIGLNPAAISAKPPEGSRAAEFSTGPRKGAPAPSAGSGLTIPGISVQGREPAPSSGAASPARFDYRIPPTATSMSAPLRPGSRTVPRMIEARFSNRTLYTMVVPKPNLPDYSGDWTIWFAEQSEPVATPQMRAPIPIRKVLSGPVSPALPGAPEGFVQISAVITKTGKPTDVKPILGRQPQIATKAAADLTLWDFRPATRNGEAVDVEVIVEIFFRVN